MSWIFEVLIEMNAYPVCVCMHLRFWNILPLLRLRLAVDPQSLIPLADHAVEVELSVRGVARHQLWPTSIVQGQQKFPDTWEWGKIRRTGQLVYILRRPRLAKYLGPPFIAVFYAQFMTLINLPKMVYFPV